MSNKDKYLFVHVNKCGGTSMKAAFSKIKKIWIPPNNSLIKIAKTEKWNELKKFTIVRHPEARLLSLQGMLLKLRNKNVPLMKIMDMVEDSNLPYYNLGKEEEYIKRHALPFTHPHYQIYNAGKLNVDKIWRLEELGVIKEEIESFLNTKLSIPKKNMSKHQGITKLERDRILELYKEDIEAIYTNNLFGET